MENTEPEASWENLYLEANNELFALREENKQAIERWQRVCAEYDNYQKRVKREKESLNAELTQNLLKNFITVADNLDLLMENPQLKTLDENLYNGVQLVANNCKEVFENSGLRKIEPATGSAFNTEEHRAISTFESNELPAHSVVRVVRAGYKIEQKVIRPADVIVSRRLPSVNIAASSLDV